jgi:hypothetical protein
MPAGQETANPNQSVMETTLVSPTELAPLSTIRRSAPPSPEASRDTLVDPPRDAPRARSFRALLQGLASLLARPFTAVSRAIATAFEEPRLTDALPTPPPWPRQGVTISDDQRGEALVLDLFRLSPRYVEGAALVAAYAAQLRTRPQSERLRAFVHLALSRFDCRGVDPVPVAWIRALMSSELRSEINRALEELKKQRAIELVSADTDDAVILAGGISNPLGPRITHVKVLYRL